MNELTGKVAVVTGAGSGIGRAIATALVAEGARVAVVDISEASAKEVAEDLGTEVALPVAMDVSDADAVAAMVQQVVAAYGTIDVLVNNAGIDGTIGPIADCPVEDFDRVIAVNLRGPFLGMKHVIPVMLANGGGSIINIASIAALQGVPGAGPYSSSKAGLQLLGKCVALEYASAGIRVNTITPGLVETPLMKKAVEDMPELLDMFLSQTAVKRLGRPEEIAAAVVFLAGEKATFMVGSTLTIDGGSAIV